ncbi:MAG: hypothetical protein U0794_21410 [Isosphaeraceae bacterium]
MADAYLDKGAAAYVGWTGEARISVSEALIKQVAEWMSEGKTMSSFFEDRHPDGRLDAELVYVGKPNLILPKK